MKICVICSGFSYVYGGVETAIFKLSELWAKQGHIVYILCGRGEKIEPKGVRVIKLPFIPAKYFQKIPLITKIFPPNEFEALSLLPFALLYLIATRPDIVLSNQLAETLPALILRIPCVMISQAPIMQRFNAFKKADLIVVNDPISLKVFKKMGFRNVEFILNGAEISRPPTNVKTLRTKYNIPEKTLVILTAARLTRQKRIHLLIKAFEKIQQRAMLIIAGDGPELSKLRSMVSPKLKNKVVFLGGQSHDKMHELYQICDVFTLPDHPVCGGWFGLVQIEAISFGRPVVTTPSKIRKIWLAPFATFPNVENPSEYAQALVAASFKKIDTNTLEFRKFIKKFDWNLIASRYIEVFNKVLCKRAITKKVGKA